MPTTHAEPQGPFALQAEGVLRNVRTAFVEVLDSLPTPVTRAHEVSKALEIDKKLGWRIYKLIHTPDVFAAAEHVPGPAGVQILLSAARRAQVPRERIDAVKSAISEFSRLTRVHAGDRATLEMMLAACAQNGQDRVELSHRRAAFRANSYFCGVQARTQLKADFLNPAAAPGMLDIASLRGFIGLRRIRANVPWVIARARCIDNDGQARRQFQRAALDPRATGNDVPLLHDFCSKPLPKFRRMVSAHGFLDDEIADGPIGKTAAITCVTGEVSRLVASYYRDPHNEQGELLARMRTPSEALVFDQIVHESLFGRIAPELLVFSELSSAAPYPTPGHNRLVIPVCESVSYLGKGPGVLHVAEAPRYAEMARYVFQRLGWDGERFDVYRVRMLFPPIPTSIVMRHKLPARPEDGRSP